MSDLSGWWWLFIDVGLVGIFAVALLWATIMWRTRRRNPRTEQATRELYRRGAENERRTGA